MQLSRPSLAKDIRTWPRNASRPMPGLENCIIDDKSGIKDCTGSALKAGADDPYVRAVRTACTYGPDVRVVCTEVKS